jgi:arginyl-tRNA synthetase
MNPTTTEDLPDDALRAFADAMAAAVAARYPDAGAPVVGFESPRSAKFGDFATNVAFSLAKTARRSPQDVATTLVADLAERAPELAPLFAGIEPVAGFINLRLAPRVWQAAVARALREGDRFGTGASKGQRISLEFGSANPTGPLVVVQGRTLSLGSALANAMRFRGYDVFTEWIINDAGSQMDTLGRSLYARYRQIDEPAFAFPQDGYPGDYLMPIAVSIRERDGAKWVAEPEDAWLPYFSKSGRDDLVAGQQRTAERFGVRYDLWQSEKELHESGQIRADIEHLRGLGLMYEQDGALYFRTTEFGDDKDRVVLRSDGRPSYFALDVAYHYEKLKRADRVIDILGPDHHGYIGRLQALISALGYPGRLDVLISGQMSLMRGTEQVSMSKRSGDIVTLDDIIDEVGVDAARFFFVMLSSESPLSFDLALAKERSAENPVYYVQYGHARIASVLRNASSAEVAAAAEGASLAPLEHESELALARRLADFPRVVDGVAEHRAPYRLARYARDVASDFHQFYTECKILVDDPATRVARLGLCLATKNVLAQTLQLVGVSAPESM